MENKHCENPGFVLASWLLARTIQVLVLKQCLCPIFVYKENEIQFALSVDYFSPRSDFKLTRYLIVTVLVITSYRMRYTTIIYLILGPATELGML